MSRSLTYRCQVRSMSRHKIICDAFATPDVIEFTAKDGVMLEYTPGPKPVLLTFHGAHIHTHTPGKEGDHTHVVTHVNGDFPACAPWMHEDPPLTPDVKHEHPHAHGPVNHGHHS